MTAFPDWQRFAVPQLLSFTGCISWSFEILLRAAGVEGIDFATFQVDFDLDDKRPKGSAPRNDFGSVGQAVANRYPWVRFARRSFATGAEKLAFVEERIRRRKPTVVSLSLEGLTGGEMQGWHIMPVVDADEEHLFLLHSVAPDGSPTVCKLPKAFLVLIHDTFAGGQDVAFLAE
jgi:hypothetical protein